ncbi:hypothetical protein ONS95_003962 [Cadophora gregata]|uniref:uncharacterized protein n=1 Tax=Cadophora gregata TaxID=51156 RepID=UPI0026DC1CCD|nr:uncharacterized protein ONS95_003962 [Cadophora gregata]KAK0107261.1 hypothetical protein ONS95_003962 [Cadophora gregata]
MAEPIEPPTTISEESSSAMEIYNNVKVSLADLCAKGTAQYAHKNFEEAAELYARAAELQAELNGEMSPDNADILFLYGRSLFKVGQSKSDVLGGKAGGEKKKTNGMAKQKKVEAPKEDPKTESEKITEEGVAIVAGQNGTAEGAVDAKKPLFQFTGDENFEDSDDDAEDPEEGEGEEEEEEDDLAVAFEVLDLARVLFTKKLEQPEDGDSKGKDIGDSPMTRHINERLADIHDLLAEISLENERFPGAVTDFRAALGYKQGMYPEESEIIAEAHFKLSLALEFASITRTKDEDGGEPTTESESHLDQGMRDEAISELELAIKSTKLKLANKEVELAETSSPDDNEVTRSQIAEVKEIVADMEARLTELKGPAVDVKEVLYGPTSLAGVNNAGGILGATLGDSPAEAAARIEEAKKTATDLSGLVRKKNKPAEAEVAPASTTTANGTNGKRKAEDDAGESDSKKAKVEDVPDAEVGA